MGKMSVSLDEQSRSWIEGQTDDADLYVNSLIHQDQEYKRKVADLKQAIQEGLDSGFSERTIDDAWNDAEREFLLKNG